MINKIVRNEYLNLLGGFVSLTFCLMFWASSSWGYFIAALGALGLFGWNWCSIIFEEADRDKDGE